MCKKLLVALILLAVSGFTFAQDADAKPDSEAKQVGDRTVKRIQKLIDTGDVNDNLAKEAIEIINDMLVSVRADQDSIYTFVRTVNRNIDDIGDQNGKPCCAEFKKAIRDINRELMRDSYTDDLFQNANLSNQIKTRLPLLIEDSLELNYAYLPLSSCRRYRFQRS